MFATGVSGLVVRQPRGYLAWALVPIFVALADTAAAAPTLHVVDGDTLPHEGRFLISAQIEYRTVENGNEVVKRLAMADEGVTDMTLDCSKIKKIRAVPLQSVFYKASEWIDCRPPVLTIVVKRHGYVAVLTENLRDRIKANDYGAVAKIANELATIFQQSNPALGKYYVSVLTRAGSRYFARYATNIGTFQSREKIPTTRVIDTATLQRMDKTPIGVYMYARPSAPGG